MPHCQVGDLAKVVHPDSLGSLVVIEKACPEYGPRVVWYCLALSPLWANSLRTGKRTKLAPGKHAYVLDDILRPLPKPPEEETPDPVVVPYEETTA
jgi:hypothetical protein